ncbi:alpha/beta hydrolase [Amycolatopsis pithecellobii]|uniref:Alpha/beta hydrolase fold domain-containing protein n=1 Tax=Amycolatopsis pithecellobii TaxID=664692 RepID=A0A6N7Z317_9PSEU|nr:alpha/beta hydrolase [Amycolatopsis pithecellobii]MTD54334.1 alpha/beta hydrolase fold domain-containing protein [Amycolatopsis pithecellobii]
MGYGFDPELQPWIPMLPALDVRDLSAARTLMASAGESSAPYVLPDGVTMETTTVPGPAGEPDVPVLIFSPGSGPSRPAMVYLHGGGFVLGDANGDQELPATLAAGTGAVVVSVDYRLAPEHPFPAPIEDCYAVLQWVAGQAGELGIDPGRIGIGGVSAGGGLAAGTALLARDRGGPALCFQLLDIPELDDRLESASMQQFADTPLWNLPNAIESWRHYLGEPAADGEVSPYAAPARATDLSGVPPAYVSVCEFDPLRDEGIAYAQRLVQHGVATELHLYPGTFHGSRGLVPGASLSQRMHAELIDAARRGLAVRTARDNGQVVPAN